MLLLSSKLHLPYSFRQFLFFWQSSKSSNQLRLATIFYIFSMLHTYTPAGRSMCALNVSPDRIERTDNEILLIIIFWLLFVIVCTSIAPYRVIHGVLVMPSANLLGSLSAKFESSVCCIFFSLFPRFHAVGAISLQ